MPWNKIRYPPKAYILYRFARRGDFSFLLRRGIVKKMREIAWSKKIDTKGGTGKGQVAGRRGHKDSLRLAGSRPVTRKKWEGDMGLLNKVLNISMRCWPPTRTIKSSGLFCKTGDPALCRVGSKRGKDENRMERWKRQTLNVSIWENALLTAVPCSWPEQASPHNSAPWCATQGTLAEEHFHPAVLCCRGTPEKTNS